MQCIREKELTRDASIYIYIDSCRPILFVIVKQNSGILVRAGESPVYKNGSNSRRIICIVQHNPPVGSSISYQDEVLNLFPRIASLLYNSGAAPTPEALTLPDG
jgi:hypothetical protein